MFCEPTYVLGQLAVGRGQIENENCFRLAPAPLPSAGRPKGEVVFGRWLPWIEDPGVKGYLVFLRAFSFTSSEGGLYQHRVQPYGIMGVWVERILL